MKLKLLLLFFTISSTMLWSQNKNLWTNMSNSKITLTKSDHQTLNNFIVYGLDKQTLKTSLTNAPSRTDFNTTSNVIVGFPNHKGQIKKFRITEASTMHPDLQERYPEIRSYFGQSTEDASSQIRFSFSPYGLSAMILSPEDGNTFIEPSKNDSNSFVVYNRGNRINSNDDFECEVTNQMNKSMEIGNGLRNADDGILRTFRLAVSTTGEYTQYHGGTKAQALAAINTTMTRVNGLFENDFNATMVLIANTDDVIYTNASTDPYSNGGFNSQVQNTLTNVIGESNYDVGHLFARASDNGNAGCIGCVCVNGQKGSAFTSRSTPEGDPFDVDYVAHELGHQFGGNHTFSFRNEGTNAHFEPGSGTTIMGYAGITGSTDVQSVSDPYFHWFTIQQVTNYIKTTSCQTNINTGNAVPTVNAGLNYTIPKGTPFVLEGTASDSNSGDVLTYCWEQADENNAATTFPSTTATSGVAFRSFEPTTDNKRYFPRLQTIKTGATTWQWEAIPNVARALNFRLTVRDNKAGGATNNSDDTRITVNGTAGPFIVNSPNTNITWNAGTTQTVTWDVAGTTGNGINAANVDILLSTDGGDTYPITLATNVTNDGSQDIIVPNNQGSQNRIMVKASNNVFFDISNTNFSIAGQVICNATVPTGLTASNISETSATLSWDAVSGASFDLRYRQIGTSTWNTVNVNGISTSVSGLAALTQYEAQVRSECPDTSTSSFSNSINFTTTDVQLNYCNSTSSNVNDEFISRVQLNTIDNSSGAQFYSDFTGISTSLTKDVQYTISVTPTWTGTLYNEGYSVWIDYNRDGDFSDAGELVFTQSPTQATPVSGSFTVPSSASEVSTRMRVTMSYNETVGPCASFTYGEVEDYTVIIEGSGPDTIAPVITLNGSSSVTLELQQAYNELGATATDNIDGDLTSIIVTSGSVNTNVAGTYTITYSVSDAAGNSDSTTRTVTVNPDTTAPVISLVGASIINLNVGDSYTDQGATATDNIDGNLTSSIVVSGSVNTNVSGNYTLTYNVSDAAGNAATPVSRVVNVNEVANGCSGGISTFPYSEGFENGIGSWTQSSADDLNWTVDANGTPSSNTGPSSAIQGSNYIFVEASGNGTGYPNKRAIITSPCFDLSSVTEANFIFKYHMFGSTDGGSVTLEVSNDEGATWISLWNQTGNQGNQWLTVNIDLAAYIGSGIQLRFNRITGGTWQADVAIDDIGLNDGGTTPVDCDTLNFNDYTLNSFSTQDSNGANSIGNGGTSLTLTNNTWKYIDFPYTVTVNTVIELEFSSTSEGEIHGIGFENDNSLTSSFYFKFYGTQNYGITNFDNYTSGTTTYVITVGDSYTGVMDRLVFINDNDAGSGNNSTFANVKIYETSCPSSRGEVVFGERVDILGNEDENTFNIKMYPNPVRDVLHVETTGIENASYRIVNMLGQTVLRGSYINQIEVGTLNSGMYFLEVNTGKKSVSQKFIKK